MVRQRVQIGGVAAAVRKAVADIGAALHAEGLELAGMPYGHFSGPDAKGLMEIEIGAPVSRPIEPHGNVFSSVLSAGRAAVTIHRGSYESIHEAYEALLTWMQEKGLEPVGRPRESWLNAPDEVKSSSELRSEVIWPVR